MTDASSLDLVATQRMRKKEQFLEAVLIWQGLTATSIWEMRKEKWKRTYGLVVRSCKRGGLFQGTEETDSFQERWGSPLCSGQITLVLPMPLSAQLPLLRGKIINWGVKHT